MRKESFAALLSVWLAAAVPAAAQLSGQQVLTFRSELDGSQQPYAVYVPRSLDAGRRYPLIVVLHEVGANHQVALRRIFGLDPRTNAGPVRGSAALPGIDFIVVAPLARGRIGYEGIGEKDIYDAIEDVKRRLPIDEDRIYLTGAASGGGGALRLALARPDFWAAVAPACPMAREGLEELAANAINLPIHLFHGELDPLVPVTVARNWHAALLDAGAPVEYVEFPRVRHNAWDFAYRGGRVLEWFAQRKRDRYPERVHYTSSTYRHASAYWVRLDALTPGTPAAIDARFTSRNALQIQTRNLDGFTLELSDHPQFASRQPLSIAIDSARPVRIARPAATLSFQRDAKGWQAGRRVIPADGKRPRAEGPMREVIAERHIYVYGMADDPDDRELDRRIEVAREAAQWGPDGARVRFTPEILSDREVLEEDLRSANLILFGTRATNALIERFAARFPIELNVGAADYGLAFLVPDNGRYLMVSSGLPWWIGAEHLKLWNEPYVGPRYGALLSFGDYLLFRGSLENVIAQGRFDRHWKVPEDQAAKMVESGAVQVR